MSPKSKEQFEIIRAQSRDNILQAALELFAENGFHKTSISQISKKAGISKGLLYNYFGSKEELLNVLISEALEHVNKVIDENLLKHSDPKTQLKLIINRSFDVIEDNKPYWKLFMLMAIHDDVMDEMMTKSKEMQGEYFQLLTTIFTNMGYQEPLKEILLFNAILDGIGFHYMFGTEDYPMHEMKEFIIKKYSL